MEKRSNHYIVYGHTWLELLACVAAEVSRSKSCQQREAANLVTNLRIEDLGSAATEDPVKKRGLNIEVRRICEIRKGEAESI
jgi:hypothetical protein